MRKELLAEGLGTGLLLYVIVGSGIVAETLSSDLAVQLLAHALIVGLGLGVLILLFQPVSGSHFNPAVTLAFWRQGSMTGGLATQYTLAQLIGAVSGVVLANITFELSAVSLAATERSGMGLVISEAVATFVLVFLILGLVASKRESTIPAAVGAWVAAIVFATASTGFANPAVTIARMFSDSYTGISPSSVPSFVLAQLAAALLAVVVARTLFPSRTGQSTHA